MRAGPHGLTEKSDEPHHSWWGLLLGWYSAPLISSNGSAPGFAFGVLVGPVLEFVGVELSTEVGDALCEAGLRV